MIIINYRQFVRPLTTLIFILDALKCTLFLYFNILFFLPLHMKKLSNEHDIWNEIFSKIYSIAKKHVYVHINYSLFIFYNNCPTYSCTTNEAAKKNSLHNKNNINWMQLKSRTFRILFKFAFKRVINDKICIIYILVMEKIEEKKYALFHNRNTFLVAKLLYKSKCPSVCPYVNHV